MMGATVKCFDGRDLPGRKPVMDLLQLLAGEYVVLLALGPASRHSQEYHFRYLFASRKGEKKRRGGPASLSEERNATSLRR